MTLDKTVAGKTGRAALAGILSGGLALGIAQLIAGLITSASSPVVAVGQLSIDLSPGAVKDFAISTFGSHDKAALIAGILVILAIIAAGIGVLAVRRLSWGMAGLGLFVLIGLIAALSRPHASGRDALPTLVGGIAAALALRRLATLAAQPAPAAVATGAGTRTVRPGQADAAAPADRGAPADSTPAGSTPAEGTPAGLPPEWFEPLPAQPGRRTGPGGPSAARRGDLGEPQPSGPGRRSFLTTSAVVAGGALVAGVGGNLLAERGNVVTARSALRIPRPAVPAPPLPSGTDLRIPGLSPFITPNSKFYRVDTAIVLPEVTPASWTLRVHGMVARELTLTFEDLIRRPLTEAYVTLTCVSDPVAGPYIGNAKWLGASLRSLLREAGVRAGADQLLCTSTDGFTSGTPVAIAMDGRDALLAVAMNGTVLPVEHGFPVRLVIPGLYGYVSACKWVTDIEVTTFSRARAYWTTRGWALKAPIKTESRIDVPSADLGAGRHTVAGVAWAQHKGIEAVEVRVDRGPWHEATLAAVPGIDTWRQWAWTWHAAPGQHLIESRATDRTGYTQTAVQVPTVPNGASGYPQAVVSVS